MIELPNSSPAPNCPVKAGLEQVPLEAGFPILVALARVLEAPKFAQHYTAFAPLAPAMISALGGEV